MNTHKSTLVHKHDSYVQDPPHMIHHSSKSVTLVEDTYGMLFDAENKPILVKRFTWSNHNKISVTVISYGARIISMKLPDRGGNVEEIVLGFDDLAGYIFYEKYAFGATIGRTTTKVLRSTYVVDGKQYWLDSNDGEHHVGGGAHGLDKLNWTPYVEGKVLQLSCISADGDNGYPGDLTVRMTFELTATAEFRISITANTSKVTPVDITNVTYVNLAGHNAGEEEIERHELLINANCHTVMDKQNEFPTGEILNVAHTRFNFQVPIVLKKVIDKGEGNEYDQNYCVNRGVDQGDAFVARLVHPYKGRILEIYSNQYGVNFCNGCTFPEGRLNIPLEITDLFSRTSIVSDMVRSHESLFIVITKLAQYLKENMKLEPAEYRGFLKNLIKKFRHYNVSASTQSFQSFSSELELIENVGQEYVTDFAIAMLLKPLEFQFLRAIKELLPYVTDDMPYNMIKDAIDEIMEINEASGNIGDATCSYFNTSFNKPLNSGSATDGIAIISNTLLEEVEEEEHSKQKGPLWAIKNTKAKQSNKPMQLGVAIPSFYKEERITGRGGVVYKKCGGISLRTQGYPNALQHPHFPSQILRPSETYKHTIVYKFWILAGDPKKWLRRVEAGPCADVSDLRKSNSSICS